jgi:hypothetical protein
MAIADNCLTVLRTAFIVATVAIAAPVLARDAGVESVSPASDRDSSLSSDGTALYAPVESLPSEKASTSPRAWWFGVPAGHLALGAGMTYQYDGSKGTDLGVATWVSSQDRYEVAAFRFLSAQTRRGDPLAEPNWIFEASRRWRLHWKLIDHSGMNLFFGMGAAYKTRTDDLNGSNWNFAEQLGWRFPQQVHGGRVEFAIRHVSNAGLKKPNRGEDFLTLAYVF